MVGCNCKFCWSFVIERYVLDDNSERSNYNKFSNKPLSPIVIKSFLCVNGCLRGNSYCYRMYSTSLNENQTNEKCLHEYCYQWTEQKRVCVWAAVSVRPKPRLALRPPQHALHANASFHYTSN